MPFGRYKGADLASIPEDYLAWLMSIELKFGLKNAVQAEWQRRQDAKRYYREPPRQPPRRATPDEAMREAASSIVTSGFRSLAMQKHPDHGGTNEDMVALIKAKDWLLQIMEAE